MNDQAFLEWLDQHQQGLPSLQLSSVVEAAGGPHRCAVVCVNMLEGYCRLGPFSSPRLEALILPIVNFISQGYASGLRDFFFIGDSHQKDSPEFKAFPPHCVKNSEETKLISELEHLPFASIFKRIDKRSVSSTVETSLFTFLQGDQYRAIFCIGSCTDLCLFHLATDLRFLANSSGLPWQIIVPTNLVATYDLSLQAAHPLKMLPHPGDLLHKIFLYQLELNGIDLISSLK